MKQHLFRRDSFMLKNLKIVFLIVLLSIGYIEGRAQTLVFDSVHVLQEVAVTSNRLARFATGSKIETIDSATISQNSTNTLADLLATQSQVFVKSYGIAGLSTPSFRGTNASQTAILWNGFNLSSPMNGGQDLALLPVNFITTLKLQYGGAGALWGSGALGGTIHLLNTPTFNKGLSIGAALSAGSFGDQQQNIEIGISKNKFSSTTKFFHHEAKNNFPFINEAQFGKPEQQLANAAFNQNGILQENYFKLTKNQQLSFRLWYQKNHREIPASMTVAESKSQQDDKALRTTVEWQRVEDKASYFVRAAYFDETLQYTDPLISLESNSQSKAFISEAESKIKLSAMQLINIGINNTYTTALTKNYAFKPTQNRTAFFGSYQLKNKKATWKGTVSARKEFISNGVNPFTASLGVEGWVLKNIRIRGIASKNYRIPTFNDLYWAQGGNPDLVPEEGFSEEVGLAYVLCKNKVGLEVEGVVFNSNVTNWIMWIPNNVGIWSPENVAKVWSRGGELDLKFYYTLRKIKFNLGMHYHYIKTTNEEISTLDQSALHKQLIYTPTSKAISSFGIEYKRFRLACTYNYVDYRYTTASNTQFLNPYHTLGLDFSKTVLLQHVVVKTYFQFNNFTNESYQIIAFYPVPGKNFQVGLTVNFNKPTKLKNETL